MSQFIRYLIVGAINFLVCIMTMGTLHYLGFHYIFYTAIGYGLAICVSFFLNLTFTFNECNYQHKRFAAFFFVSLINLSLVECIEVAMIESLHTQQLYAIMTGMIFYTLSGFVVNKFYIYSDKQHITP